jgi:GT2 family glycosyltransferase
MTLSIIIVSWNVREKLRQNLAALFSSRTGLQFDVWVVDNASADRTAEMVRSEFPQVRLIANDRNLGFAKANNLAIKRAEGEFILLLNPDMRVQEDTLDKMVGWFKQHPQAAVAGCKLTDEQGNIVPHVRRFPSLADQLAIVLKLPHLCPGILDRYLAKDFNYDLPGKVDSIRGSFFLMRRTDNQLPLLDERYFVWFEEVDYCRTARSKGLEVWYSPVATCIDYVGGSFSQVKRGTTQKYFQDSMLQYFLKWHPRWQYRLLSAAWHLSKLIIFIAGLFGVKAKNVT